MDGKVIENHETKQIESAAQQVTTTEKKTKPKRK